MKATFTMLWALALCASSVGIAAAGGTPRPGDGMLAQAAGTAGAAGAGAGAAAGTGAAGRPGTGTATPGVTRSNTGAGVTARDPAASTSGNVVNRPSGTVEPPAGITPPPGSNNNAAGTAPAGTDNNGVVVSDPLTPDGAGRLENLTPRDSVTSDRQRTSEAARGNAGNGAGSPANQSPAAADADFAAALRSCEGLPPGEKSACQAEARKPRGRM